MRNLIFLISEEQRNFCNKRFDSVETRRNSAIAEQHFRTKLKHCTQNSSSAHLAVCSINNLRTYTLLIR